MFKCKMPLVFIPMSAVQNCISPEICSNKCCEKALDSDKPFGHVSWRLQSHNYSGIAVVLMVSELGGNNLVTKGFMSRELEVGLYCTMRADHLTMGKEWICHSLLVWVDLVMAFYSSVVC